MEVQTPANEAAILPGLSDVEQKRYAEFKEGAQRAANKYPDMDTSIYTEYLSDYLTTAQKFRIAVKTENGAPLDPRYVKARQRDAEFELAKNFDRKYPIFADQYTASASDKARAATNTQALQRLRTEVEGEGIIASTTKLFYNEEKNGFQFGNIAGGIGGGLLGFLMGSFIAGAAGGGWMGFAVIALLTLSGAAFGANVTNQLIDMNRTPEKGTAPEKSNAPAQAQAQSVDPIDQRLAKLKDDYLNGQKDMSSEAKEAYATTEEMMNRVKTSRSEFREMEAGFQADKVLSDEEARVRTITGNVFSKFMSDGNINRSALSPEALDKTLSDMESQLKDKDGKFSKEAEKAYNFTKNFIVTSKQALDNETTMRKKFEQDGDISDEEKRVYNIFTSGSGEPLRPLPTPKTTTDTEKGRE